MDGMTDENICGLCMIFIYIGVAQIPYKAVQVASHKRFKVVMLFRSCSYVIIMSNQQIAKSSQPKPQQNINNIVLSTYAKNHILHILIRSLPLEGWISIALTIRHLLPQVPSRGCAWKSHSGRINLELITSPWNLLYVTLKYNNPWQHSRGAYNGACNYCMLFNYTNSHRTVENLIWWWHAQKMVMIYFKRIYIHCFMASFLVY